MHLRPHEKLIAWQRAYELCLLVYSTTRLFPEDERFGLISQMRRSAASVPINIAEGNAKGSAKDKRKYLNIAQASLEELHCQLRLSLDLQFLKHDVFTKLEEQVQRTSYLLVKLRASL